ncbi:MAG: UbiA family prenyltransferase [bacterium]|jgi:hypothetical protein
MSTLRAWLEIMRISNAPTVLSNGIAGGVLGALAFDRSAEIAALDVRWLAVLSPLACYLGGMVLNDAFDAAIDARERPARPIPSGRISRGAAFAAGAALLLAGVGIAAATGPSPAIACAVLLALAVVAYNAIHALTAASIVLLAACRALAALVPMCVFAGDWQAIAPSGALLHPALLAAWTLLLSFLARSEAVSPPAGLASCPSCGHLIKPDAARCSECGKTPNPAIAQTRMTRNEHLGLGLCVATFTSMGAACMALLPQPSASMARATSLGCGAVVLAFVFAPFLAIAARRVRERRLAMPRYIGMLIATLAVIDTIALTAVGSALGVACAACAAATLLFQRRIAGS